MRVDTETSLTIVARIADTVASGTLLCVEAAAQLSLGQAILGMIDRFLWIIEKSAQWSLPYQNEITENGKSFGKIELVRPLPWVFFLPTLILLRVFRISLNVGAMILGCSKIEPSGMVQFLQKSRRRLRYIKWNGRKYMRQRKNSKEIKASDPTMSDVKWRLAQFIRSIQLTLSRLSCLDASKLSPSPPPMKIKVGANHESTPTPEENSTTESATSPKHVETKRKYSEMNLDGDASEGSEEESITTKIERLAALDDTLADEDYNPQESSNSNDDSSSISEDSNISTTDIQNLQDEANLLLHRALAGVAEVIKEEPEQVKRLETLQMSDRKLEKPRTVDARKKSEEHQEYYSPLSLPGDDVDTAYYSPISSKSPSPERRAPVTNQALQVQPGGNGVHATGRNGQVHFDPQKPVTVGSSADKRPNGHAEEKGCAASSVSGKVNKPPQRVRRVGHVYRKKK